MKINLSEAFEFIKRSKSLPYAFLKWGLLWFGILIFAFMGFGLPIALKGSQGDEALVFMLFCTVFSVFFVAMYSIFFYASGASINNFKRLRKSDLHLVSVDDLNKDGIFVNILEGLKYTLIIIYYMLPSIILYLILTGIFVFFAIQTEGTGSQFEAILVPFAFLYILFVLFIFLLNGLAFSFVVRPVIYEIIYKHGYFRALNFMSTIDFFKKNPKQYFISGVLIIIPYIIWYAIQMMSQVLIYFCIGIFLIPLAYTLFMMIKMYLEPYLMAQLHKENNT